MSQTPFKTVKETGAEADDVLVGISAKHNTGILVRIFEKQEKDSGGRIRGAFEILHEGTGKYSEGIKTVTVSKREFDTVDEFVQTVGKQKGCHDCTHLLNANALWKLDVESIINKVLVEETE